MWWDCYAQVWSSDWSTLWDALRVPLHGGSVHEGEPVSLILIGSRVLRENHSSSARHTSLIKRPYLSEKCYGWRRVGFCLSIEWEPLEQTRDEHLPGRVIASWSELSVHQRQYLPLKLKISPEYIPALHGSNLTTVWGRWISAGSWDNILDKWLLIYDNHLGHFWLRIPADCSLNVLHVSIYEQQD